MDLFILGKKFKSSDKKRKRKEILAKYLKTHFQCEKTSRK